MADWITCTSPTGEKFDVNLDHAFVVHDKNKPGQAAILPAHGGKALSVKESREQLMASRRSRKSTRNAT